jgi:glycosyltransferase involved in cell wall biosynthesis
LGGDAVCCLSALWKVERGVNGLLTVAIPTLNGGQALERTLAAVKAQRTDREFEIVVCDSGSQDGSPSVARKLGAEVIEIERAQFSHGGTRNLLMRRSQGEHVAFLTQDAMPADELWLSRLLDGFALSPGRRSRLRAVSTSARCESHGSA